MTATFKLDMPAKPRAIRRQEPIDPAALSGHESAQWVPEHALAAAEEGWGIFEADGSDNGPWQAQAFDDVATATNRYGVCVPKLGGDDHAWRLVFHGVGPHHAAARVFLQAHNPIEWAAIEKVGKALGSYPGEDREPENGLLHEAVAALSKANGRVLITSWVGLDLMESDRVVEFCTLSASGQLSMVRESAGAEWEIQLLSFAAQKPPYTVLEDEGVYSIHSRLLEHLSRGQTAAEAMANVLA